MKTVVFLGSKNIGAKCFAYLLDHAQELGFKVIAAATQSRSQLEAEITVKDLAIKNNIPLLQSMYEIPECDIIYSVQYHLILDKKAIDKAKQIAVNLHLAPLPEYRGCNQFSFAIMNQEKEFGVSIHKIDERIDHGALIFEKRFEIEDNIWVEDLVQKSTREAYHLFQSSLKDIIQNNIQEIQKPQNIHSHLYFRKDIENLKALDLKEDTETTVRKIRATLMPGFDPPHFIIDGTKYFIHKKETRTK